MKEIMKTRDRLFIFFIVTVFFRTSLLFGMEGEMLALVPDTSSVKQSLAFPRTVPTLVMCCLKPACLARLEKESHQALAIWNAGCELLMCYPVTLFQNDQKRKDATTLYYALEFYRLVPQLSFKKSFPLLNLRWKNCCRKYANMYAHHGKPAVNLEYVLQNSKHWRNDDDFLHYFDEILPKLKDEDNLNEVYKKAIWYHAPQGVYPKLAACGVQLYKGEYLDYAVWANNPYHTQYLLEEGTVSVQASCKIYGLLHFIVANKRYNISLDKDYTLSLVETLLRHGADFTQKNDKGLTPGDVAWLKNKTDLAELLDSYEDSANLKMHMLIPVKCGGLFIPEGLSARQQRTVRRQKALEKGLYSGPHNS